LITHDFSVVRQPADRVIVMYLGNVIEDGPASDVIDRPAHPYTQGLVIALPVPDPTGRGLGVASRAEAMTETLAIRDACSTIGIRTSCNSVVNWQSSPVCSVAAAT
jgi:ABC-type dipeptide/oligopeptide/nickel transport system ATPase component